MPTYKNLPSINIDLQDGNLRVTPTPTGPVTLVIGCATDGPNGVQTLSTDSNASAALFGASSPLIKRASELKLGGTKNILLYRIGGVNATLTGVGGADCVIQVLDANVISNTEYSLYLGPNPDGVTTGAVLIIFRGNIIVFSNVPGSESNVGEVTVTDFDPTVTYQIGTPTAPVVLNTVATSTATVPHTPYTAVGDGTTVAYTFYTDTSVGGTSPPTIGVVKVNNIVIPGTGYTLSTTGSAPSIAHVITFTVAPASTNPVNIAFNTSITLTGTYIAGDDSIGCTWQQYYQIVDAAYDDIQDTIADCLVVDRVILDAPNVADGSTATDKLEYLNVTEDVDGNKTYTWSATLVLYQTGTAPNFTTTPTIGSANKDANGQPIIAQQFYEVNFAHQLGTYCYQITTDDEFVIGTIGVSLPASTTTAGVASWIGSLPTTNAAGTIVVNGTGLLGNKFMSGSTARAPGFFLTDSGFVTGNVQSDTNGVAVDLGKFMSIVAGAIVTPNSTSIGTTAAIVNGAAVYASLTSTITPGNSTTNTLIPGIALPFSIRKTKLDALTGAKYVTFTNTAQGVTVVSGSLATTVASDYQYVSTTIIVQSLLNQIRTKLTPYLGRGINAALLGAANTAVETILQAAVTAGAITAYQFNVVQGSTPYALNIPLMIVPVFELRSVYIPLSLALSI